MKTLSEKFRIALIVSISLSITIVTICAFSQPTGAFHQSDLKLKNDQLIKQRVRLEKSLDNLKMDLASLQRKNYVLDRCVADAKVQIAIKESDIKMLLAGNADSSSLAMEITDIGKIRKKLSMEVNGLNLQLDQDLVQLDKHTKMKFLQKGEN